MIWKIINPTIKTFFSLISQRHSFLLLKTLDGWGRLIFRVFLISLRRSVSKQANWFLNITKDLTIGPILVVIFTKSYRFQFHFLFLYRPYTVNSLVLVLIMYSDWKKVSQFSEQYELCTFFSYFVFSLHSMILYMFSLWVY